MFRPSRASTSSALKVEAVPLKAACTAFSVTVPAMPLLLAAVMPLTVTLPVLSPRIRLPAVMRPSSTPSIVRSPAVAPRPMLPPSETSTVVVPAPLSNEPARSISLAVMPRAPLPVVTLAAAAIVRSPAPLLSTSVSRLTLPPVVVKSSLSVMPVSALRVTAPVPETLMPPPLAEMVMALSALVAVTSPLTELISKTLMLPVASMETVPAPLTSIVPEAWLMVVLASRSISPVPEEMLLTESAPVVELRVTLPLTVLRSPDCVMSPLALSVIGAAPVAVMPLVETLMPAPVLVAVTEPVATSTSMTVMFPLASSAIVPAPEVEIVPAVWLMIPPSRSISPPAAAMSALAVIVPAPLPSTSASRVTLPPEALIASFRVMPVSAFRVMSAVPVALMPPMPTETVIASFALVAMTSPLTVLMALMVISSPAFNVTVPLPVVVMIEVWSILPLAVTLMLPFVAVTNWLMTRSPVTFREAEPLSVLAPTTPSTVPTVRLLPLVNETSPVVVSMASVPTLFDCVMVTAPAA